MNIPTPDQSSPEIPAAMTRRARRQVDAPSEQAVSAVEKPTKAVRVRTPKFAARRKSRPATGEVKVSRPLRALAAVTMIGGLVAAIAIPAFGLQAPAAEAAQTTLQKVALDDAQTLVVASDVEPGDQARSSYEATTEAEIKKKKEEEAAAAALRARAAAANSGYSNQLAAIDFSMTAPGSGEVRWPVSGASWASYNLFRPPGRPSHNGLDMMIGSGTPIYAATSGVVRTSTDGGGSYGAYVVIDGVVGGQSVSTLYAHMSYGTRTVGVGQYVEAGQMIGQVGSTGFSTAPHCHFEVRINGGLVDPLPWLNANAG